mmetsp:Transcript_770/g.1714  ORF Transcript_770/g.1714 Transcript_770/m.1714 type:complete len:501 (-) Transcript_770:129-1631(-)
MTLTGRNLCDGPTAAVQDKESEAKAGKDHGDGDTHDDSNWQVSGGNTSDGLPVIPGLLLVVGTLVGIRAVVNHIRPVSTASFDVAPLSPVVHVRHRDLGHRKVHDICRNGRISQESSHEGVDVVLGQALRRHHDLKGCQLVSAQSAPSRCMESHRDPRDLLKGNVQQICQRKPGVVEGHILPLAPASLVAGAHELPDAHDAGFRKAFGSHTLAVGHLRTTTAARRTICGEVVVKLIVFEALINRRKLQCIQVHPVHRVLDKLLDLARCQGGRCSLPSPHQDASNARITHVAGSRPLGPSVVLHADDLKRGPGLTGNKLGSISHEDDRILRFVRKGVIAAQAEVDVRHGDPMCHKVGGGILHTYGHSASLAYHQVAAVEVRVCEIWVRLVHVPVHRATFEAVMGIPGRLGLLRSPPCQMHRMIRSRWGQVSKNNLHIILFRTLRDTVTALVLRVQLASADLGIPAIASTPDVLLSRRDVPESSAATHALSIGTLGRMGHGL